MRRETTAGTDLRTEETWSLEQAGKCLQAHLRKMQNTDHRILKTAHQEVREITSKKKKWTADLPLAKASQTYLGAQDHQPSL